MNDIDVNFKSPAPIEVIFAGPTGVKGPTGDKGVVGDRGGTGLPGDDAEIQALTLTVNEGISGVQALISFEKADRVDGDIALALRIDVIDTGLLTEAETRGADDDALGVRIDNIDTGLSSVDEARINKNTNDITDNATAIAANKVVALVPFDLGNWNNGNIYNLSSITLVFGSIDKAKAAYDLLNDNRDAVRAHLTPNDIRGIELLDYQDRANFVTVRLTGAHFDYLAGDQSSNLFTGPDLSKIVKGFVGNDIGFDDGFVSLITQPDINEVISIANSHSLSHDVIIGDSFQLGRAWTHDAVNSNSITFTFENAESAAAVMATLGAGAIGPIAGDKNDARIVVSVTVTNNPHIVIVYLDGPLVAPASSFTTSSLKFWVVTRSGYITRGIGGIYDPVTRTWEVASPQDVFDVEDIVNANHRDFVNATVLSNAQIALNTTASSLNTTLVATKANIADTYTQTQVDALIAGVSGGGGGGSNYDDTELRGLITGKLGADLSGLDTSDPDTIIKFKSDTGIDAEIEIAKSFYVLDGNDMDIEEIDNTRYTFGGASSTSKFIRIIFPSENAGRFVEDVSAGGSFTLGGVVLRSFTAGRVGSNFIDLNYQGDQLRDISATILIVINAFQGFRKDKPIAYLDVPGAVYNPDLMVLKLPAPVDVSNLARKLTYNNDIYTSAHGNAVTRLPTILNTFYSYQFAGAEIHEFIALPRANNVGDTIEFVILGQPSGSNDLDINVTASGDDKINGVANTAITFTPNNWGNYKFTWTGASNIGWAAVLTTGRT